MSISVFLLKSATVSEEKRLALLLPMYSDVRIISERLRETHTAAARRQDFTQFIGAEIRTIASGGVSFFA